MPDSTLWVNTSATVHMPSKSPLTQNEGASLCGLLARQLRVLLRMVKLQGFHESLKASLALASQNVQQTTCWIARGRNTRKKICENVFLLVFTPADKNCRLNYKYPSPFVWLRFSPCSILTHGHDEWPLLGWPNFPEMKQQRYELGSQVFLLILSLTCDISASSSPPSSFLHLLPFTPLYLEVSFILLSP